MSLCFKLICS